ncbi:MAG: adenine nucleotide alpha hydrolase [Hyphomicrobiaceae bacterium]
MTDIDANLKNKMDNLSVVLREAAPLAIAVSGGVDSLTLASFAQRTLGSGVTTMIHASSPAVPADALQRIRELAEPGGWDLRIVNAGEFADERYRSNPVDRCFFCKTNLYRTLRALHDGTIASGTNTDDLGDYRPGLSAAQDFEVRHPFVEAVLCKADVRALSKAIGLDHIAELPASPCLSSRIETGIRINRGDLGLVDQVETWMRRQFQFETVRCRIRPGGVIIEVDAESLNRLNAADSLLLRAALRKQFDTLIDRHLTFAPYRRGSSFIGKPDRKASGSNAQ